MSYGTFTLTGRYKLPDGTANAGTGRVVCNTALRDATGNDILAGPLSVTLDGTGAFTKVLPAADAGLQPQPHGFTLTMALHSGSVNPLTFAAPAAGSTLDTADIADSVLPPPLIPNGATAQDLAAEAALARNATNLTSGTVADARLPSTAQAAVLSSTYAPIGRPAVVVTLAAPLSLAASTPTVISWSSTVMNAGGFWSAGSPTRLTVPTGGAGLYCILSNLSFAVVLDVNTRVFSSVLVNGAAIKSGRFEDSVSVNQGYLTRLGMLFRRLSVGDYVEMEAFHASATAKDADDLGTALQLVQLGN